MHNFFIHNKFIVVLTEYNKLQITTEYLKIIIHYLSVILSHLYITYVINILSFMQMIQHNQIKHSDIIIITYM